MATYLAEMRFAAESVLNGLWHESEQLEVERAELAVLASRVRSEYARADSAMLNAETPDDVMHASAMAADTYFGVDQERHMRDAQLVAKQEAIEARSFSMAALAGTLLQYGKQGLSIVHNKPPSEMPLGRQIGKLGVRDVIWQGRNQAIHWEEGNLHPPAVAVFERLSANHGHVFSEYRSRSLAFEVIALLGWREWSAFEADLLSLG